MSAGTTAVAVDSARQGDMCEGEMWTLTLRMVNGKSFTLQLGSGKTVADLRALATPEARTLGGFSSSIKLFLKRKELEDKFTLQEAGLADKVVLLAMRDAAQKPKAEAVVAKVEATVVVAETKAEDKAETKVEDKAEDTAETKVEDKAEDKAETKAEAEVKEAGKAEEKSGDKDASTPKDAAKDADGDVTSATAEAADATTDAAEATAEVPKEVTPAPAPVVSVEPVRCTQGCGFFGNPKFGNMCSKCYNLTAKEAPKVEEKAKEAKPEESGTAEVKEVPGTAEATSSAVASTSSASAASVPAVMNDISSPGDGKAEAKETKGDDGKAEAPEVVQENKSRCFSCNKRIGLTGFQCRCEFVFCSEHRYAEAHSCEYDYKLKQRELLNKQNPVCAADKLERA